MKKLVIFVGIIAFMIVGCNDDKSGKKIADVKADTSTVVPPDTSKAVKNVLTCTPQKMDGYKTYTIDETADWADNYHELLRQTDSKSLILQLIPTPDLLNNILCNIDRIRLVSAAKTTDPNQDCTMMMEYVANSKSTYYDIMEIFGQGIVCPPPNNCGIPLTDHKASLKCSLSMKNYHLLDPGTIAQSQKDYASLVQKDHGKAITIITLTPGLINDILCDADVFKLIGALDSNKNVTAIVGYEIAQKWYYYDAKELFGKDCVCLWEDQTCVLPLVSKAKNYKPKK